MQRPDTNSTCVKNEEFLNPSTMGDVLAQMFDDVRAMPRRPKAPGPTSAGPSRPPGPARPGSAGTAGHPSVGSRQSGQEVGMVLGLSAVLPQRASFGLRKVDGP